MEAAVIFGAVVLGILCVCGLGWFLVMVIAPLGLAVFLLCLGLLGTLIGFMSLFRAQRREG